MALGRGGSIPPSGIRASLLLILVFAFVVRAWFGHFDPTRRRFDDERYALENVGRVLRTGEPKPANGYHPTLSYLPQVAVQGALQAAAELSGNPRLAPLAPFRVLELDDRPDRYPFTKAAFLAGRWLQALLGTLAVALTFAIGRLVGGPVAGLIAATLAASAPQLVRRSAIINEDAGLLVTVLGAVLAAAVAGSRRSLRSYLVAGLAVGLAGAAKFNGVAAACPLVAVTLMQWRDGRAWARLAAAGGIAIVTFLLLNPFVLTDFDLYRTDFGRTLSDYGHKAERQGHGRGAVLVAGLASVLEPTFLGTVGGVTALLGLALLAHRAARGAGRETREAARAVLGYALGYPLLYAVATGNVSLHNWSPLLPLMAIAAAVVVTEVALAASRLTRRPAAFATVAVLFALGFAGRGAATTYRWVLPSTSSLVGERLAARLDSVEGRVVLLEDGLKLTRPVRKGAALAAVVRTPDAASAFGTPPVTIDALVLRHDGAADRAPRLRALAARGRLVEVVAPRLGLRRGPPLGIYLMGWRRAGPAAETVLTCVRRRGWVGTLETPRADVVSFAVPESSRRVPTMARLGGRPLRLRTAKLGRGRVLLYSDKIDLRALGGDRAVEIPVRCPAGRQITARVLGWTAERPAPRPR